MLLFPGPGPSPTNRAVTGARIVTLRGQFHCADTIGNGSVPAHMFNKLNKRNAALLGCLGLLTMTVFAGAGSAVAQDGGAAVHEVTVTGSDVVFTPADLTVDIGDTVYFHWEDTGMDHNVAESDSAGSDEYKEGGFRSGDVAATVHFNVTFDEAGTFYYICEPHTSMDMKGTVTVVDPDAVEPEATPGFAPLLAVIGLVGAAIAGRRAD